MSTFVLMYFFVLLYFFCSEMAAGGQDLLACEISGFQLEKWLSYWTRYERGHILLLVLLARDYTVQTRAQALNSLSLDNMLSPPTSASPFSVFLAVSLIPNILCLHSIRFTTSLQTGWGENVSRHFFYQQELTYQCRGMLVATVRQLRIVNSISFKIKFPRGGCGGCASVWIGGNVIRCTRGCN